MARKGENIYKRKDKRWEGRYIKGRDLSGKARFGYVYGKTYLEVKKALIERKAGSRTVRFRKSRSYRPAARSGRSAC